MSEFIVKTLDDWKSDSESLPAIGKPIEVLCTMITRASLVATEPVLQWKQEEGAEMETVVKLWREVDERQVCEVESPPAPEAV